MSRAVTRGVTLLVVGRCVLMLARHDGGQRRFSRLEVEHSNVV